MFTNIQNPTQALRLAAAAGDIKQLQTILAEASKNQMFDINERSSNGNTALLWSVVSSVPSSKQYKKSGDYKAVIDTLIKYNADDTLSNKAGDSIYSVAHKLDLELLKHIFQASLKHEFMPIDEVQAKSIPIMSFYFFLNLFNIKAHRFLPQNNVIKILSLGCGVCNELLALIKFMKIFGKQVEYYGVDLDTDVITATKKLYKDYPQIKLFVGDASLPESLINIQDQKFNFGLLRNGDFTEMGGRLPTFTRMVDQCFPRFSEDESPVLLTFYTKNELDNFTKSKAFESKYLCKTQSENFAITDAHVVLDNGAKRTLDNVAGILNFSETLYRETLRLDFKFKS